jgi:kanamycin kinase
VSIDLAAEAARLDWTGRFTPVPVVLELGADEQGIWLATEGLPGQSAVARRWLAEPRRAVAAIGEGLRAFHETLPVLTCPFRWRPDRGQPAPEVEPAQRVICHGDACAPNTLIDHAGRWAGAAASPAIRVSWLGRWVVWI